jgi:hypothetical protein
VIGLGGLCVKLIGYLETTLKRKVINYRREKMQFHAKIAMLKRKERQEVAALTSDFS